MPEARRPTRNRRTCRAKIRRQRSHDYRHATPDWRRAVLCRPPDDPQPVSPPLEAQFKRLSTTASEDLSTAPALPEEALASLTRQLRALQRGTNAMSNTSTDTLLHNFRNLQGQLADPITILEAPLDTHPFALGLETTHATFHTPTQKPDTLNHTQPGPPSTPPPTRPGSRFFFGTELCILLPSGMTKAPRFLQNRSFPLE